MTEPPTRLEQALGIFLEFQHTGGEQSALLARHPEFADLLGAFLEENDVDVDVDGDGAAEGLSRAEFGEFRLVRELGRGGIGVVFEARQPSLDRRVALKVLHAPFLQDPTVLVRFRRESLTLARLDHPGIVRVLDSGTHAGQPWLAMEFVEGESLAQRLDHLRATGGHRDDSLRRLLEVVESVANALHHAHEAGVVHRDVKPSNILLRGDAGPVLVDFGLARDDDDPSLTRTGTVAGTPHYMSPEQVRGAGADCDARTDVFSLGATLYECITLSKPFDGPTSADVLRRILTSEPADPRGRHPRLAKDLAAILAVSMEKDVSRRYPDASAFAEDLRAFLDLRPVRARPPSTVHRVVRYARREPTRASLAVLAAVVVALGVGLLASIPAIRAGRLAADESAYDRALAAGLMARAGQDRDESFRQLGRALELFPMRGEAIAMWCLAMRNFDGPEPALAELDRREIESDDPDLEWLRVLLLTRCGRPSEADALEARLETPRSASSLWLAGVLELDRSRDDDGRRRALAMLSLATRVAANPRLLLHLQWAACASAAKDAVAKHESAESLLRLWPDEPVALHYAAANLQDSEPGRAADQQRRALDLGLDDPNGLRNLGAYLYKAGRGREWVAPLQQHLAAHPDDQLRDAFLGMLEGEGLTDVLDSEAERWIREAPDQPLALRWAGRALVDRDDLAGALPFFRRAVALTPDDPEAHYDLAVATDTGDDATGCAAELRRVLELAPDHERAHRRLLAILADDGDAAGVLSELSRWVAIRPGDRDGWLQLADAATGSGDASLRSTALLALDRADVLSGGVDADVLGRKADVLDALDCGPAAAVCRELAAGLRQ